MNLRRGIDGLLMAHEDGLAFPILPNVPVTPRPLQIVRRNSAYSSTRSSTFQSISLAKSLGVWESASQFVNCIRTKSYGRPISSMRARFLLSLADVFYADASLEPEP